MGLIEQAQADILQITTNGNDFGMSVTFQSPNNATAIVNCLATKHHLSVDPTTGNAVNAKNASIAVSEQALVLAGFAVRNASNEVNVLNYKVSWIDSSGYPAQYKIRENWADEVLGLIVCILGDYQ